MKLTLAAILTALTAATGVVGAPSTPPAKTCEDLQIPIKISAMTKIFPVAPVTDNLLAAALVLNFTRSDAFAWNYTALPDHRVDKTFYISARYCIPTAVGERKDILQIMTHGIGCEKSYWDWPEEPSKYSYVDAAIQRGYSTFIYDRITTGGSSKPDAYLEVQVSVELAILKSLTEHLRAGVLPGGGSKLLTAPGRVVHVGHSLGSILTNVLVATWPALSDGVILTGFAHSFTLSEFVAAQLAFSSQLARLASPRRFAALGDGYLAWPSATQFQLVFFDYPNFDPKVLLDGEARKSAFTVGELLSLTTVALSAPKFTGYVQVLTGNRDLVFCGGHCNATAVEAAGRLAFPNAGGYDAYVIPEMGHALNLHLNAVDVYDLILEGLEKGGL
ncbi:hypothetical protein BZA05DRAFT_335325 [Tricharina praecox]|uniref:uncharacterized protein n=1 Tax=Tricharina praecox TaxID=43433 RepID=UPI00221E8C4E|nr:uncharacterized protein BZA05DRAFT_335325 [Tricharina praecox]KAI5854470.1 hypothetical protein BZA05DRAFT_335325 [Tricharina praecox]